MKEEAKSKKDLLKELKSLHRKINRLEKTNRNINISQSEEIRRTEKKYYNIFEESLDGLYISSPEGKILDVNKRGLMIFGYDSKDEIYKLDLAKDIYTNPADRQRILSMVNSQGSAEYEVKYKKKNGEIMDMYCSLVAEKNGSGEIISYRGIVRDISKQKYAEKVLSESEERYHSIFENSISAVFLINQEGSIIAANPEASRIFGWAEEEFRLLKTDAIIDTTDTAFN